MKLSFKISTQNPENTKGDDNEVIPLLNPPTDAIAFRHREFVKGSYLTE